MRKIAFVILLMLSLQSCSVYMAAKQEDRKTLSVFAEGTDRSQIIGAIGSPTSTDSSSKDKIDYFNFTQGYSTGSKTARALAHGALDVMSIGLWEVIGTPVEAGFDGYKVMAEVTYDENNKAKKVKLFKDGKPAQLHGNDIITQEELDKYNSKLTDMKAKKSFNQ